MYATVQELVDALTLEEKAGLCAGAAVPRLGLPALRVNGLHSQESAGGVCFPSACAAAASFDPEAARRMGAALGREIYDSFTADVEADLYVLAHATSPFIRAETVADALRHVRSGEYDSAFSAEKIQTFAWFEGRPLNYALDDIPRTQTIEPVYIETSAFFIFPRTLWCGRGRRIGEKPYMAVVDRIEGLDIDNPEDFTMAEIIAASRRLG